MDFDDIFDSDERKMWERTKAECYGKNIRTMFADFSPRSMADVVGGEGLTYDEYLEIQFASYNQSRGWFETCYYDGIGDFKGRLQRVKDGKVCFSRIYVCVTLRDGTCLDGREDHVWMDCKPFAKFNVGDCVSFCAEVYRYLRTGKGKSIDFGLRNPYCIKKLESYKLPSDDDLLIQEAGSIVCEMCLYQGQCYRMTACINPDWHAQMLAAVVNELKAANTLPDAGRL